MRTRKDYENKGVSHHHLLFGRDSKTGRGAGKLSSRKKMGGFRYCLTGDCQYGEEEVLESSSASHQQCS